MQGSKTASGSIAFIGFGEPARAFLDGWRTIPAFRARVSAYDIKTNSPDPEVRASKRADYVAANVIGASSAPEAVAGAEAVFRSSRAIRRMKRRSPHCRVSQKARSSSTATPVRPRPRSAPPRRSTRQARAMWTSR